MRNFFFSLVLLYSHIFILNGLGLDWELPAIIPRFAFGYSFILHHSISYISNQLSFRRCAFQHSSGLCHLMPFTLSVARECQYEPFSIFDRIRDIDKHISRDGFTSCIVFFVNFYEKSRHRLGIIF